MEQWVSGPAQKAVLRLSRRGSLVGEELSLSASQEGAWERKARELRHSVSKSHVTTFASPTYAHLRSPRAQEGGWERKSRELQARKSAEFKQSHPDLVACAHTRIVLSFAPSNPGSAPQGLSGTGQFDIIENVETVPLSELVNQTPVQPGPSGVGSVRPFTAPLNEQFPRVEQPQVAKSSAPFTKQKAVLLPTPGVASFSHSGTLTDFDVAESAQEVA
jgi:hypothetical protein